MGPRCRGPRFRGTRPLLVTTPLTDAVWVTDALLAQTYDRFGRLVAANGPSMPSRTGQTRDYATTTTTTVRPSARPNAAQRRQISFTPGPLECRWRANKRTISRVNICGISQPHPATVVHALAPWRWIVDTGSDADRIEWEPPSPAHVRRQREEVAQTLSDLSAWLTVKIRLPAWLRKKRKDGLEFEQKSALWSVALPTQTNKVLKDLLAPINGKQSELQRVERKMAAMIRVESYFRFVRRQIELGTAAAQDVRQVLDTIPPALQAPGGPVSSDPKQTQRLLRLMYSEIIEAMCTSAVWKPSMLSADDWRVLLRGTLDLEGDDEALCVFASAMGCLPGAYAQDVQPEVLEALGAVARGLTEETSDIGLVADSVRHLERFLVEPRVKLLAKALRLYSASDMLVALASLDSQVPPVRQPTAREVTYPTLRAMWLAVMAHMPLVNTPDLCRAILHMYPSTHRFGNRTLARTLMARWGSLALYTDPTRSSAKVLRAHLERVQRWYEFQLVMRRGNFPLALLLLAVARFGDGAAKVRLSVDVWVAAGKLGRDRDLVNEFGSLLRSMRVLNPDHVWLAAMTTDDHEVAMQLHGFVMARRREAGEKPIRPPWAVWAAHFNAMCADEELDPRKFLKVLGALDRTHHSHIGRTDYNNGHAIGRTVDIHPHHQRLVEQALAHFAYSDALDDAVAFLAMLRGIDWLLFHRLEISRETVEALQHIVVRYLDADSGGMSDPCAYLVRVIQRWHADRGLPMGEGGPAGAADVVGAVGAVDLGDAVGAVDADPDSPPPLDDDDGDDWVSVPVQVPLGVSEQPAPASSSVGDVETDGWARFEAQFEAQGQLSKPALAPAPGMHGEDDDEWTWPQAQAPTESVPRTHGSDDESSTR